METKKQRQVKRAQIAKKLLKNVQNVQPVKLDNATYTARVESGDFPDTPVVPLAESFVDDRGAIKNLLFTPVQSVAVIESKNGTVRSNHYHLTDSHYLYVVSGEMEYYERELYDNFSSHHVVVKAGGMVFTPPMKVHKTVFTKDTVLISCATKIRNPENHDKDMVKQEF